MIKAITSKDNGRIKFASSLKEKKYREENKMFLAETKKALEMALKANRVSEVFTTEYLDIPEEIPQYLVSEELLKRISNNVNPEGAVFIAKMDDSEVKTANKILFLDEITDPGNMGTLIRTALAFSYDLVIVSDNCVSIYNEKVVNSSKGAIFNIPVRKGKLSKYKGSHQIIVSMLSKKAINLDEIEVKDKFVLVLGNESRGVSSETRQLADIEVIIPINNIDSLNVAVAGGILMNKIH
jgi:TrmH family RNA methyltransferase